MRLIDADALEAYLDMRHDDICERSGRHDSYASGFGDALWIVETTQAVEDAVVVVRCKDCVHYEEWTDKWGAWKSCNLTDLLLPDGNGYCNHGERVSDNE